MILKELKNKSYLKTYGNIFGMYLLSVLEISQNISLIQENSIYKFITESVNINTITPGKVEKSIFLLSCVLNQI